MTLALVKAGTVQFLIEYEKISFSEAIRSLAEKHNIEIIEVGDEQQSNLYDQLYEIHNLANLFFINNLSSKKGIKAKSYMKDRFFDDTIIKNFPLVLLVMLGMHCIMN